jgi:hypothetical protein
LVLFLAAVIIGANNWRKQWTAGVVPLESRTVK